MGVIRLPVSGDYVSSRLVVGVSALGCDEVGMGTVTVWCAELGDTHGGLAVFQVIHVSSLTRAREVRDTIARLAEFDFPALPGGDWIHPLLICGVCTKGAPDTAALTTVWISDSSEDGGGLHVFCHIEAEDLTQALTHRDTVAALAGMDPDSEGYDPADADTYFAGEFDDDAGEGGSGAEGEGEGTPSGKPAKAGKGKKAAASLLDNGQMLQMLQWWDPETSAH